MLQQNINKIPSGHRHILWQAFEMVLWYYSQQYCKSNTSLRDQPWQLESNHARNPPKPPKTLCDRRIWPENHQPLVVGSAMPIEIIIPGRLLPFFTMLFHIPMYRIPLKFTVPSLPRLNGEIWRDPSLSLCFKQPTRGNLIFGYIWDICGQSSTFDFDSFFLFPIFEMFAILVDQPEVQKAAMALLPTSLLTGLSHGFSWQGITGGGGKEPLSHRKGGRQGKSATCSARGRPLVQEAWLMRLEVSPVCTKIGTDGQWNLMKLDKLAPYAIVFRFLLIQTDDVIWYPSHFCCLRKGFFAPSGLPSSAFGPDEAAGHYLVSKGILWIVKPHKSEKNILQINCVQGRTSTGIVVLILQDTGDLKHLETLACFGGTMSKKPSCCLNSHQDKMQAERLEPESISCNSNSSESLASTLDGSSSSKCLAISGQYPCHDRSKSSSFGDPDPSHGFAIFRYLPEFLGRLVAGDGLSDLSNLLGAGDIKWIYGCGSNPWSKMVPWNSWLMDSDSPKYGKNM